MQLLKNLNMWVIKRYKKGLLFLVARTLKDIRKHSLNPAKMFSQ